MSLGSSALTHEASLRGPRTPNPRPGTRTAIKAGAREQRAPRPLLSPERMHREHTAGAQNRTQLTHGDLRKGESAARRRATAMPRQPAPAAAERSDARAEGWARAPGGEATSHASAPQCHPRSARPGDTSTTNSDDRVHARKGLPPSSPHSHGEITSAAAPRAPTRAA